LEVMGMGCEMRVYWKDSKAVFLACLRLL
jgi:hypothetical protein